MGENLLTWSRVPLARNYQRFDVPYGKSAVVMVVQLEFDSGKLPS